jgi:hypothetical protein
MPQKAFRLFKEAWGKEQFCYAKLKYFQKEKSMNQSKLMGP